MKKTICLFIFAFTIWLSCIELQAEVIFKQNESSSGGSAAQIHDPKWPSSVRFLDNTDFIPELNRSQSLFVKIEIDQPCSIRLFILTPEGKRIEQEKGRVEKGIIQRRLHFPEVHSTGLYFIVIMVENDTNSDNVIANIKIPERDLYPVLLVARDNSPSLIARMMNYEGG